MTGEINEDARILVSGIEMQPADDIFGNRLRVVVDEGKQAEAGEQHDHPFRKFKNRHSSQPEWRTVMSAGFRFHLSGYGGNAVFAIYGLVHD